MVTDCSNRVSVQGWVFEVRRARRDYECFYCGNRIPAKIVFRKTYFFL